MTPSYSWLDHCIMQVDQTLRIFHHQTSEPNRAYPVLESDLPSLSIAETRHAAGLMRVNHTGEVCAQALYQGQALTARKASIRQAMQHAAVEERDHLAWCERRLTELNASTSYLNPIWYLGSLVLGIAAGIAGDQWSLGFLAETERQVTEHLTDHLQQLPAIDSTSRQIVEQMRYDEQQHAHTAVATGAAELPAPIKLAMKLTSKVMTTVSYYI